MYLHDIRLVNEGPIENCSFDMPFNENGNPKPLILVGSNGSGKTILISSIVDALYEMYINAGYRNPTKEVWSFGQMDLEQTHTNGTFFGHLCMEFIKGEKNAKSLSHKDLLAPKQHEKIHFKM